MSEIQNYTLAIEATPEYTIEIDSNSSPEYTLNLEAQPNYTIETGSNVGGFWGALNGDIQNQEDLITLVDTKVDKVEGKGLSANDLTDELKEDYDQAVLDSHTHTNKDLLDDITDSGDGDLFLADDGTYKDPVVKTVIQIGTSSTASATAEKAVVCEGFELVDGVTIMTTFDNSNTASGDYLQVSFNGNANDDFGLYTPTVIGSPTFTNNKFNSNENTGLSYPISTLGSGTWCIQGKFKSTNTSTTQVFIANGTNTDAYLQLIKNTSNKLGLYLSSNGSSNDIADGVLGTKSDWGVGTEYYIRLRFTGTQYLVDWSVDETSWTNDIAVSSTSPIYTRTYGLYFGIWANVVSPLIGTMDDLRVSVGSATITDTRLKINANSTGAVSLVGIDGKKTSYLPANTKIPLFYDGTNFVSLLTNTGAVTPNYANGISKSWNTLYTAEVDGWLFITSVGNTSNATRLYINSHYAFYTNLTGECSGLARVSKGDIYEAQGGYSNQYLTFYPAKGAK